MHEAGIRSTADVPSWRQSRAGPAEAVIPVKSRPSLEEIATCLEDLSRDAYGQLDGMGNAGLLANDEDPNLGYFAVAVSEALNQSRSPAQTELDGAEL